MAGTVTHAYFVKDIYDNFGNENKKLIELDNFKTYGQSHDVLFFSIKNKIRKLGNYSQRNSSQNFFINSVNYIKDNNLKNNGEILSFLYGYICHYCLDYNVHPFIKYKTGVYKKGDKKTLKYNGKHNDMESYLDFYLIYKKSNMLPWKLDLTEFCINTKEISKELLNLIDYCYYNTFNIENVGKEYKTALRNMRILYKLFRNDKHKIKKKVYNFFDKITPRSFFKLSPISLAYKIGEKDYYLNLEHENWNHPMYINEKHNESFFDLYQKAFDDATRIINEVNAYLFENKNLNLDDIFTNLSFSTGKNCEDKTREQFFEY